AKLVGKKVKARAVAIGDGIVWAELLSPVQAAEEPLTAEAEAERPTRARRPTAKKIEDQVETEAADAVVEPESEEEEEAEEADADGALSGEASVPVKKKTRRGSRGGRNRKRKPAAAEAAEQVPGAEGDEQVPGTEPDEPPAADEAPVPAPVIHVPDRELTDDDADEEAHPPRFARRPQPPQEDRHRGRRRRDCDGHRRHGAGAGARAGADAGARPRAGTGTRARRPGDDRRLDVHPHERVGPGRPRARTATLASARGLSPAFSPLCTRLSSVSVGRNT